MHKTPGQRRLRIELRGQNSGHKLWRWILVSGNGKEICFGKDVYGYDRCVNSGNAFKKLLSENVIWEVE